MYVWSGTRRTVLTRGWWLPRREKWYLVWRHPYLLTLHWRPYHGIRLAAESLRDKWPEQLYSNCLEKYEMAIKKRDPLAGPRGGLQGPAGASVILAKLPAVREFLSSTEYEDKSPRTVGNIRIGSQGRLWEVTVQDPDALARMTVRDESLDKALLLVEQLLGVDEAPWETDRYLAEKAQGKHKKK